MYKLILSVNNLEEVMVWPSVPPDFGPEQAQRNGTYEGISGDFNTLGPMGLWSIPLSGVFPVGRRPLYMPPGAASAGLMRRAAWTSLNGRSGETGTSPIP